MHGEKPFPIGFLGAPRRSLRLCGEGFFQGCRRQSIVDSEVKGMSSVYKFQLLRYAPNRLSEEFYNVAILLYGADGRLADARFTPDFLRLRCHPLADLDFLHQLKDDFERHRLQGEGFSEYVDELRQNLSQGLQVSEGKPFLGGEAAQEIERLCQTYLATPRPEEARPVEAAPGTRRWILDRLRETFGVYHLLDRLETDVAVGGYVSPRFSFHVDYAYKPNGQTHFIHALSLHRDLADASRLCFLFDRLRTQAAATMTAVVADALPEDTSLLLQSSQIRPWPVSRLDDLALAIRQDLGL